MRAGLLAFIATAARTRAHAASLPTGKAFQPEAVAMRPVRSVATPLSLVLALALFAPAAEGEVLISNLNQSDTGNLTVGGSGTLEFFQALGFRTGAHTDGYRLTSVKARFHSTSAGVRVRIFSSSGNNPDSSEYTTDEPVIASEAGH